MGSYGLISAAGLLSHHADWVKLICRTCWIRGTYPPDKTKTTILSLCSSSFPNVLLSNYLSWNAKKPATTGGFAVNRPTWAKTALFLPRALLMTVRLEALPAFVFRHLQTPFLFQITHRFKSGLGAKSAASVLPCKAFSLVMGRLAIPASHPIRSHTRPARWPARGKNAAGKSHKPPTGFYTPRPSVAPISGPSPPFVGGWFSNR